MIGERRPWLPAAAILGAGAVAGCQEATLEPPTIHFGEDICHVCGMIISDDRFAAAIVLDAGGRFEPYAFDDIGCLLASEAAGFDHPVAARYVRGFRSRAWADAGSVTYVHSAKIHSPMAFGLAACDSAREAGEVMSAYGGETLDLEAARRRYDAGQLVLSGRD